MLCMVTLTARIHISCARTLHFADISEVENRRLFGVDWSPESLGGNLVIEASVCGMPEPVSGMLINPPDLEQMLKKVAAPLDHRELNGEIFNARGEVPSLENIGLWLAGELDKVLPPALTLQRMRVKDGRDQWIDVFANRKVRLTKVFHIECVHRHHNPDLSMEENQKLYHKCSAMHGHSYKIEVVVERPIERGLVMARAELDQIVNEKLVAPMNGTLLNDHLGNTSGEIIAQKFFAILAPHLNGLVTVVIRETRKNSFFFVPNSFQSATIWDQV